MLKRKEKDRELRLEWGVWGLEEKRLIFSCKKFETIYTPKQREAIHCIMLFLC